MAETWNLRGTDVPRLHEKRTSTGCISLVIKTRDGARGPGDLGFARTEAHFMWAETSNLRGTDVPRKKKKDIQMDVFFLFKESARRDSNPRPRPWQGRAPPTEPLAHFPGLFTRQMILYSTPRDMSIHFLQKIQKLTLFVLIV